MPLRRTPAVLLTEPIVVGAGGRKRKLRRIAGTALDRDGVEFSFGTPDSDFPLGTPSFPFAIRAEPLPSIKDGVVTQRRRKKAK